MQHCLSFPPQPPHPPVLVFGTGPRPAEEGMRLIERALVESGLARFSPQVAVGSPPRGRLVIAFGAEAAASLLRRPVGLNLERGRLRSVGGTCVLVTEHPDAILRHSDPVARGREYRRLVNDLQQAVPMPRRIAA